MLKQFLHGLARRFPQLATLARPVARPLIAIATRDNVAWVRSNARQRFRLARRLLESRGSAARLHQAARTQDAIGIGARATGRRIIMLLVSNIWVDPRVEREARALAAAGYAVEVICPDTAQPRGSRKPPDWGPGVAIELIRPGAAEFVGERPGFIGGEMFDAAMRAARRGQPLAFHGHDLNTSYAALAAARVTGAHFIADFHEWTSENVHWDSTSEAWTPYAGEWKAELQALEARIMTEASAVVTVSQSIVEALAQELGQGRRATLVRNIPLLAATPTREYPPLKQQFGLPDDSFVLLYQGGTGPARLLEPIIEALAHAPRCILVLRGPSLDQFGEEYRAIARRIGADDRLILGQPVPSRDVVAAAKGADAGIYSVVGVCRNFTHALPNKVFEYMASGLPALVVNYPEVSRMVEQYGIGLSFDPHDPVSIAAAINRLIDDPALCEQLRRNTVAALSDLDAEAEWQKLVHLYDELPRAQA